MWQKIGRRESNTISRTLIVQQILDKCKQNKTK